MIGSLRYTCIETRNLSALKGFYTEKLGIPLKAEGEGWFTLNAGGHEVVVWEGGSPTVLMGLLQPELEAARATLAERGAEPGEIESHPGGNHFMVKDPDGNLIMVTDD